VNCCKTPACRVAELGEIATETDDATVMLREAEPGTPLLQARTVMLWLPPGIGILVLMLGVAPAW